MKKFLTSVIAAAVTSGLACSVLTVNAVEEQQDFYVSDDSVVFYTMSEPDVITSTVNDFRIERFSGMYGASFVPEEDGYYVVSIVQNYNERIIGTSDGSHVHYFYPTVQTYSIIKDGEEITVRDVGKYSGYDEETVNALAESESMVCYDYYTKAEFSDYYYGEYYSLVNGYMPSYFYFTYFDYSYETADKKDRSQFLISDLYAHLNESEIPFAVTGNSELIETGYTSSGIGCDNIFNYYVYAPTGDGETEISYLRTEVDSFMNKSIVISAENGLYIPQINIVESTSKIGDVNGDGQIGIADMVSLQRYLLASIELTENQKFLADLNGDGRVDVYDMISLRKMFVE